MTTIFLVEIFKKCRVMLKEGGCCVGFERNVEDDGYMILDPGYLILDDSP